VPAGDAADDGDEKRGIAEQLKRELGEEGADAADEIHRRVRTAGREEPDRVGRLVRDERDQPDERHCEEADAQKLAEAA
jgi:hypothetical protein